MLSPVLLLGSALCLAFCILGLFLFDYLNQHLSNGKTEQQGASRSDTQDLFVPVLHLPTYLPAQKKALQVQKSLLSGTKHNKVILFCTIPCFSILTRQAKVRTSVHFHLPKTKQVPRDPKYPRSSVPKKSSLTKVCFLPRVFILNPFLTAQFTVIKYPLATESAMRKIEDANTIVYIVDIRANKNQIKSVVKELYNVEVAKVNTLITPAGEKKAFVKLTADYDALEVSNKIGIV